MVSKLDENDQLNATLSSFNSNDQVPLKNNRLIDNLPEYRGSVLIFVPGMHDIQTLNDLITKEFPAASQSNHFNEHCRKFNYRVRY